MMTTVSANAQHREGDFSIQPRVGVTFSTLTNTDDAKMKVNLTYGVEFEHYITELFSVAGGVLFTNQGAKYEILDEKNQKQDSQVNIYYGALPITANYYLLPGLAVKAGIQPAFRFKANIKIGGEKVDFDKFVDYLYDGEDNTMNKFDLSVPVGLSYEFMRVTLDARYNIGITNLIKGDNVRQQVIAVTLGYKF